MSLIALLAIAFLVYLTGKGELTSYLALFGLGTINTAQQNNIIPQATTVGSNSGSSIGGTLGVPITGSGNSTSNLNDGWPSFANGATEPTSQAGSESTIG